MQTQTNILRIITKLQNNFNSGLNKNINFLFCDIQDKYIPKIYNYKDVISTAENLSEISKILNFNQIVTEHNPKTFGITIDEIKKHLSEDVIIKPKTKFSMLDDKDIINSDLNSIYVIIGIEAHVCVTQTAISVIKNNRDVIILADGVSSVNSGDRNIALKNLRSLGAYVTTSQSFLFMLLQDSKHNKFKDMLPILKKFTDRENLLLNETKF